MAQALDDLLRTHVARFTDRLADWDAFADARVEGFKRAQHRFIGPGASGKVDASVIPAQHSRSRVVHPARSGNAPHTHEVEGSLHPRGQGAGLHRGRRRTPAERCWAGGLVSCPANVIPLHQRGARARVSPGDARQGQARADDLYRRRFTIPPRRAPPRRGLPRLGSRVPAPTCLSAPRRSGKRTAASSPATAAISTTSACRACSTWPVGSPQPTPRGVDRTGGPRWPRGGGVDARRSADWLPHGARRAGADAAVRPPDHGGPAFGHVARSSRSWSCGRP